MYAVLQYAVWQYPEFAKQALRMKTHELSSSFSLPLGNGAMSVSIERFACTVDDPCAAASFAPVCGGRRFRRHFNKRDFPVLGEDYEDAIDRCDALVTHSLSLGIITLFE